MKRGNIKYDFDRSFFKHIDSPEKAYYLGFFMGRGSIKNSEEYISFNFKQDKKYLLENLLKIIGGSPEQIKYYNYEYNSSPVAYLCLASKEMIEDLKRHGVPVNNKSMQSKPVELNFELQPYFWRGLFDTKGHIAKRYRSIQISFYGNESITNGFKKFMGYNDFKIYKTEYGYLFQKLIGPAEEMKRFYYLLYSGGDLPLSHNGLILKESINDREAYEKVKFAEDPEELMYKKYIEKTDSELKEDEDEEIDKSKLFNYMISKKYRKNRKKELKD